MELVRHALEHNVPLCSSSLKHMFDRSECAMLKEAFEHSLVNGQIPDDVRSELQIAVTGAHKVPRGVAQVLNGFGHDVCA
jgi:hypothetical protein